MKNEDKKQVPAKNENNTTKPTDGSKPKKKVTASSINNIIKSPTGQARANSSGSHLDDGTWVDYEDENK